MRRLASSSTNRAGSNPPSRCRCPPVNLSYALFTGGHLHLLGGFEPARFVDELASRRIQLTQLVPTLIQAVTREVSARAQPPDLSSLVEIVYGASPIRPDALER